jgi:hypothetical protein
VDEKSKTIKKSSKKPLPRSGWVVAMSKEERLHKLRTIDAEKLLSVLLDDPPSALSEKVSDSPDYNEVLFKIDRWMPEDCEDEMQEYHALIDAGDIAGLTDLIRNAADSVRLQRYMPKGGSIQGLAKFIISRESRTESEDAAKVNGGFKKSVAEIGRATGITFKPAGSKVFRGSITVDDQKYDVSLAEQDSGESISLYVNGADDVYRRTYKDSSVGQKAVIAAIKDCIGLD